MSLNETTLSEPVPEIVRREVTYEKRSLSRQAKRRIMWCGITVIIIVILCVLFAFIGIPLIFMNSIALQRLLMFTTWNLPSERSFFQKYEIKAGLRNLYVTVHDLNNKNLISLGVWHLLPFIFEDIVTTKPHFEFDQALKNSNRSVLLYFHGTGEDRSSVFIKYTLLRFFFHVVTFDYRSYGDSSKAVLSEDAVVNDCVQLYEWLTTKTQAPIIVWGHSLGTALATRTIATIQSKPNITKPAGLILEAPFTKMSEELYVHPYGKLFAWLPWFEATIVKPLEENGFTFDNKKYIKEIHCPVMILSAEDDSIVPFKFGKELYEIARNRSPTSTALFYQFDRNLRYNHNFIYEDPFLLYYVNYFRYICSEWITNETVFPSSWTKL